MEITKRGARADHGWQPILRHDSPEITWHKASKRIELSVSNVRAPNSKARHHYAVYLTISDAQKIIEALAEKGIEDCQVEIASSFSAQLDKLLKIMMCSVGIVVQKRS